MQLDLDDINENEKDIDIVIISTDGDYQTDEDDIDEDDIQGVTLPLNILRPKEMFSQDENVINNVTKHRKFWITRNT